LDAPTHRSASPPPDPAVRAGQIRYEQIKVVYRHLPVVLAINAVVAGAMMFGLWGVVARTSLAIWGGMMLGVLAVRAVLGLAYRRATADAVSQKHWGAAFAVGSGLSGALWGLAGVILFPPGSLEYQLFILFVLMGMGAGAITSLTAYMPAFYAFLPVSLAPIGVMLIRVNDPIHIALGVMTFAYVAGLTFFARTINKSFIESLGLRFENVDLVRALSIQRDEAERANIAKSKFLAAASHDLRQPLQSLTLFASVLNERIKYPEVSKIVGNINASVRALEQLFNALLDISRLDAGMLQPALRHFRLQEIFDRLMNDHAPEAAQKGITLECAPAEVVVYSDVALLERILRNLVSNAVRYTEQGGVRITSATLGDQVRIEVADTGIGIPADRQREIFDEFTQLGNPERDRTKGLGLGLAIVDRVARLLGYPLHVESRPGAGSHFSVEVPRGDAQRLAADELADAAGAQGDVAGLRVMVVDDEIGIREGMRTLLEQWGCAVVLAGSEDEAVAAARQSGFIPEVVIADFRLRDGRTGAQAIQRLERELGVTMPALIVTGDTAAERLREARTSGYQLVHKPVQPAMLRAFLRNARHAARPT
jgi:signal transduction histidine kinase/CheY-like chemotaxis protein